MRILYINTLYSPDLYGGAERVLQTQVEALAAAGHKVAVLAISSESGLNLSSVNGIPVWRAGIRNVYSPSAELRHRRVGRLGHALWHLVDVYNPLMARIVDHVAKEFKPEVASCHNLPGWSISAWDALAANRIPVVQVLHDQYLLCPKSTMYRDGQQCASQCVSCRLLRLPHRHKSSQVDTLVGVSSFISRKLMGYDYFDGVRSVKTIHNIRDTLNEDIPRSPRRPDGSTVFGYIGRLSQSKGIEFLLNAFVTASDQSWELLIAGSGEAQYETYLKQRFEHPRIQFLDQVTPGTFFPQLDFTVVPSLWQDTLPSVVFESLLYGCPVLGSDLGGIPEMLNAGNGRLFVPGDQDGLIQEMRDMAAAKALFRASFEGIQREAGKYCDKQGWVQQWCEVYSDAIEFARRDAARQGCR